MLRHTVSRVIFAGLNLRMKNINLLLNIVLTLAVVLLFALYFNGKKGSSDVAGNVAAGSANMRIAYFNSDSIMANYQLVKDEKAKMEQDMKSAEDQFAAEQKQFQKDVEEFQARAQFLTITDKEAREAKLGRKQQELAQLEQTLSNQLAENESAVTKRIFDSMKGFMDDYAKKNKFTYVLSYARGGQVWYADSTLDITSDMLKHLNEDYKK